MNAPRPLSADKYSDSFMLLTVAPRYDLGKHRATFKCSRMLHMKTIDEIRYDNLQRLVMEAGGLTELVEKSGNRLSRPTLYQILEKKTTASGAIKNVGDELARKIEEALRLEPGWMDNLSDEERRPAKTSGIRPDIASEIILIMGTLSSDAQEMLLGSARDLADSVAIGRDRPAANEL